MMEDWRSRHPPQLSAAPEEIRVLLVGQRKGEGRSVEFASQVRGKRLRSNRRSHAKNTNKSPRSLGRDGEAGKSDIKKLVRGAFLPTGGR